MLFTPHSSAIVPITVELFVVVYPVSISKTMSPALLATLLSVIFVSASFLANAASLAPAESDWEVGL